MATVINKDKIQVDATLYPGQVLLANNLPVVTTDEVAVEINTSYDAFGNETVTGFNTLTDKLAYIDQSIAQIPSLSINKTSTSNFNVCGGNDTGSEHTIQFIHDITLNGSTLNVFTKKLDFNELHSTLSSILSRLDNLENGSSGSTQKASISNPGDKTVIYNTTKTISLSYTGLSTISVSSSDSNTIAASISNRTLSLKAKKGSGSAFIHIWGDPSTYYLAPDMVTFTATANKANNTITISPETTSINVVNGLYNGISYYTINNVTTTAGTGVQATSSDVNKLYFRTASQFGLDSYHVNDNTYFTIYFGGASNGVATVTLSNPGTDNYTAAQDKVITFNFSNNTSSSYKYYLGVNPESIITNTSSVNYLISGSGAQTATSKHTEITWPASDDSGLYQLYIYPTAWGTIKGLTNKSDNKPNKPIGFMTYSDLDITPPTGYAVIAISDAKRFGGTTSVITW